MDRPFYHTRKFDQFTVVVSLKYPTAESWVLNHIDTWNTQGRKHIDYVKNLSFLLFLCGSIFKLTHSVNYRATNIFSRFSI